ncbi:glycosyltransferase [Paenibacillus mucilaginosus]|uniref:CapM n=1 Tax=Paenibacillus mucilaginosus (strain KNP414) TaxID=1036673 RepID=F8FQG8_PAEMK|nr:glycosyltransferase [Paenibacillus mucilaginosus]AEI39229.1 CapM [Paenibacillus mucilaginosus KNP414]MCG7217129.1 glycosyltransferase [Paenibacillus mucilaginosus]WDM28238.1 glycosyltransferase [Paenibacillus mucilaginosus]
MSDIQTISIIIPCYNQGQYLEETLCSVEASTYPYIEVIVVDDGSTNEESNLAVGQLKGHTIKGQPVHFLHQTNQGPAAARNHGASISKGEYILFLDCDDLIDPTYLEKAVWVLTKHSHLSFVYPSVQHFGAMNDVYLPRTYNYKALLEDNYIVVSSLMRKRVWSDINGFDTGMGGYEDWDFWIRAGAAGHEGYWWREPLFFYRRAASSRLVTDNGRRKMLIKELRSKHKHIYEAHFSGDKHSLSDKLVNKFRPKLAYYKWKLFVTYVRFANMFPAGFKDKVKGWIKPVIRYIFKYEETGHPQIQQEQVLNRTPIDEAIETRYQYHDNENYINLFNLNGEFTSPKNKKPSILFIVPWLVVGGADKVNLDLISKFIAKGHQVHVFTTLLNDHPWHQRFKDLTPYITHLGNVFSDIHELLDYANDYITAKGIDIIQMSNSQLGYQMAEVLRTCHPNLGIVDLNHMEEPYAPFDYFRYSVRYKDWFDHRVVITPYLKEVMVRKYGEAAGRVTVIPNGIEVPTAYELTGYSQKPNASVHIGFVGRMEEQKQPLDFVKTARIIMDHNPNVRFTMIGDGSLLPAAKNLAKALRIQDAIEFMGSRNDAPAIMKERMHIFLAPSLREGLPIVGLEALSLGIPIVATDVPGWIDLVFEGQTGFMAQVNDCTKMAEYCLRLIEDTQLRESMSKQCYELALATYALEMTSEKYLDIYKAVLQQKELSS